MGSGEELETVDRELAIVLLRVLAARNGAARKGAAELGEAWQGTGNSR